MSDMPRSDDPQHGAGPAPIPAAPPRPGSNGSVAAAAITAALANLVLIGVCVALGFISMFIPIFNALVIPLFIVVLVISLTHSNRRWGTWASLKGPGYGLLAVFFIGLITYVIAASESFRWV